jgi:hypothetical protein
LRIASIYPELLGTYGDGGNAVILAARARWRGLAAELVEVRAGDPIPGECDVYLLGGGEDEPQALAAAGARTGALAGAVSGGAVLLAVCAGLQIVGLSFPATDGRIHSGAELVDATTLPGATRAVGDLVVRPRAGLAFGLGDEPLYGYENHGGRTTLGPGVAPLGAVVRGIGNGAGQVDEAGAYEGLWAPTGAGLVIGTYLHGPVLAQNPQLAEVILERVAPGLPPLDDVDPRAAAAATAALRAARARQTARR